jgi:hypothetical protein
MPIESFIESFMDPIDSFMFLPILSILLPMLSDGLLPLVVLPMLFVPLMSLMPLGLSVMLEPSSPDFFFILEAVSEVLDDELGMPLLSVEYMEPGS